jgi:hypothetical protein
MGKLKALIEEILKKHGIDPSAGDYYLKLRMPNCDSLVIGKVGDQVLIGRQNANLINSPVLSYYYNQGNWFPVEIEQISGTTICSFIENGNRMYFPYRIRKFMLFQRMFEKKIREQGFLENGVKVE